MFPTSNDSPVDVIKHRLSVDDRISLFEDQRNQWLSEAYSGKNTNLNLVSKSGVVIFAHQALLLPRSSYLKRLVEASESCGCNEDAPTLLLPDVNYKVIQATLELIYSGSVIITDNLKDELMSMIHELQLDIPMDQLIPEPMSANHVSQLIGEPVVQSSVNQFEKPQVQSSVAVSNVNQSSESSANPPSSYQHVPQSELSFAPRGTSTGESSKEKIKKVKVETDEINDERQNVRNKSKDVHIVLEHVHNDASFIEITHPLENLPTNTSFNSILPLEIKSKIFCYLCDSEALVAASVCREWKEILGLYDHIEICCPVLNVSAHILETALTSVSTFALTNYCSNKSIYHEGPILTITQQFLLLHCLENNEAVKGIKLHGAAMDQVDQDRLISRLFNSNIKKLMLRETFGSRNSPILNVSTMILNLKLFMIEPKLTQLNLGYLKYPDRLAVDMADALCQIKTVCLSEDFPLKPQTWKRLVQNILHGKIRLENLIIVKMIHWHHPATMPQHDETFHLRRTMGDFSVSSEDLRNVVSKLNSIFLRGCFPHGHERSVRSLPGVDVESDMWHFGRFAGTTHQISKGIDSLDAYFCL